MLRYLLYNLIISFVKEFVNMAVNYRKTLISCYLGFITQAIAANFAPLLFLTFHWLWYPVWENCPYLVDIFCYSAYHRCAVRTFRRQNRLSEMRYRFAGVFCAGTYRACFSARTASQSVFRNNYKHGHICNGKRSDRGTCKSDS